MVVPDLGFDRIHPFAMNVRFAGVAVELRGCACGHLAQVMVVKTARLRGSAMKTRHVILREIEDADGSRLLTAALGAGGELLIEGRDCGDGVERIFGVREYEWAWTIPAEAVAGLLRALQAPTDDVLAALRDRFGGENAADIGTFLEFHRIPTTRWSRTGD